ncbi:hypothetical protein Tco_0230934 [Tanacetum coccineum]
MSTPMATERLDADLQGTPTDQTTYHRMIGGLMYLTASRPDIAYATFVCARYQAYADHAGCKDDCKSTSGGLQFLGEKLVSWSSKKQDCTTMSTTEAEYVSDRFGYVKNHKKTVKNGQTRTRETEECARAGSQSQKVKPWSTEGQISHLYAFISSLSKGITRGCGKAHKDDGFCSTYSHKTSTNVTSWIASLAIRKVEATLKSAWTEKDQIDNLLKERRLMRSLEKFVGGKLYEGDLRLRQKNHMILSYDVLINQFDESNANVLERFYTSAGYPVKEILLKLNLPDHRILKDGSEDFRYSDTERLSRSDEVLKLMNFKKDATLKLSKSTNQEWYEHVSPEVTRLQDDKVTR